MGAQAQAQARYYDQGQGHGQDQGQGQKRPLSESEPTPTDSRSSTPSSTSPPFAMVPLDVLSETVTMMLNLDQMLRSACQGRMANSKSRRKRRRKEPPSMEAEYLYRLIGQSVPSSPASPSSSAFD